MRWTAPHTPDLAADLAERFGAVRWPDPPEGFVRIGPLRPMRQVLRGRLPAFSGRIYVKWHRPVTRTDRWARAWRGGKGPREGRLLNALRERGLPVPRPLAFTDEGEDLLATEELADLRELPVGPDASRSLVRDVARLLSRAWAAGLRHPDLHRENLAHQDGRLVLVDLGGARVVASTDGMLDALGVAGSSVAGGLSRSQRLRGLRAWLEDLEGAVSRKRLHDVARRAERATRDRLRTYRFGRDRRARRTGRQFEVLALSDGSHAVRRQSAPAAWTGEASSWSDAENARDLKAGDGRVRRLRPPGAEFEVVVKRYDPIAPGRLPRAIRAFRVGVACEHRDVTVPRPLLALSLPDRSSLLVSAAVDGEDLHGFTAGGRGGAFADLPPCRRRHVLDALGRFLRHLHDEEVTHRDLKAPNLLVDGAGDRRPRIRITDLDGAKRAPGPVGWRRRARDLARLDASLDARPTDRARVLRAYWRIPPRPPLAKRRFAGWIAAAVAKKRGASGKPR